MKQLLLCIALLIGINSFSQDVYKRNSQGKLEKVIVTNKKLKHSGKVTGDSITISSVKYPIYKGIRGGLYIIRTSKKTGNEYRKSIKIVE